MFGFQTLLCNVAHCKVTKVHLQMMLSPSFQSRRLWQCSSAWATMSNPCCGFNLPQSLMRSPNKWSCRGLHCMPYILIVHISNKKKYVRTKCQWCVKFFFTHTQTPPPPTRQILPFILARYILRPNSLHLTTFLHVPFRIPGRIIRLHGFDIPFPLPLHSFSSTTLGTPAWNTAIYGPPTWEANMTNPIVRGFRWRVFVVIKVKPKKMKMVARLLQMCSEMGNDGKCWWFAHVHPATQPCSKHGSVPAAPKPSKFCECLPPDGHRISIISDPKMPGFVLRQVMVKAPRATPWPTFSILDMMFMDVYGLFNFLNTDFQLFPHGNASRKITYTGPGDSLMVTLWPNWDAEQNCRWLAAQIQEMPEICIVWLQTLNLEGPMRQVCRRVGFNVQFSQWRRTASTEKSPKIWSGLARYILLAAATAAGGLKPYPGPSFRLWKLQF